MGGIEIILLKNKSSDECSSNFKNIIMFSLVFIGLFLTFSYGAGNVAAATVTSGSVAPVISSINPGNNVVNVPTNQKIKITYNKQIKFGKTSWIELKKSSGTAVPFTSTINGSTLYITPKSQLAHKTSYVIILHSGSIKDLAGNGITYTSTKFTTIQTTKTYSANGISFNYPSKWMVDTDTQDGAKYIFGMSGYNQDSPQFQVEICPNPPGMTDQEAIDSMYSVEFPSGFKIISKQTYTLNGNKVYGMIFTINNKKYYPETIVDQELNILKNHKIYTIDYIATLKEFNNEKIDFSIITKSLKIQ